MLCTCTRFRCYFELQLNGKKCVAIQRKRIYNIKNWSRTWENFIAQKIMEMIEDYHVPLDNGEQHTVIVL